MKLADILAVADKVPGYIGIIASVIRTVQAVAAKGASIRERVTPLLAMADQLIESYSSHPELAPHLGKLIEDLNEAMGLAAELTEEERKALRAYSEDVFKRHAAA